MVPRTDSRGFRAPMEHPGLYRGPPWESPVDLGQKKFLKGLFIKLKAGNIKYFNINNCFSFSMHITYNLYILL